MKEIISFCGDRCDLCPRYLAYYSNDEEYKAEVANLWHKMGWRKEVVSNDEIICKGCNPLEFCYHNLGNCAKEKNIQNCGQCNKYSCEKIDKIIEKSETNKAKCLQIENVELREAVFNAFFKKREILDKENSCFNNAIEDLLTAETLSSVSEMFLKIKKPDYLGDSKWEFRHGKSPINASIIDNSWLLRFRNREFALMPGDSLKAKVKTEVKYDYDREVSSVNYFITEVLEVVYSKTNPSNNLF